MKMKKLMTIILLTLAVGSNAAWAAAPTVKDAHAFIKKWIEQGGISQGWKFTHYTEYQSPEKCKSQFTFEINIEDESCRDGSDACKTIAKEYFGSDKSRIVKVSWANVSDIKLTEAQVVKISILNGGSSYDVTFVAVSDIAATRAAKAFTLLKNACIDTSGAKFD